MMDAMFELPSGDQRELLVTLDYARQQFEKSNLKKLRAA